MGPNGIGEWFIFVLAMTGLGIIGLMIAFMGILAIVYGCKLAAEIFRNGF